MPHSEESLKQYYAARAREYERIYAKPERQAELAQLRELLPPMFADRRVLEVACGTAYWTQFLVTAAESIVAVDANPETLEIAAEKSWPSGRVRFRTADAYSLSAELGVFDAAFAGFWWSHVAVRDRPRFLSSLDQRLLPRAKVVFLDNLFVEGSSTPIAHRDDEGNSYQRRRLDDGSEHMVLKNFPSASELNAAVSAYGCNARFISFGYYWLFSYEKAAAAR
jgi:ubiquinone/menaquinone biosynthesis C-methylase UbiE